MGNCNCKRTPIYPQRKPKDRSKEKQEEQKDERKG